MAEVEALQKLQDKLNCLICLDTYTDPKQLQCHHVYCQTCLMSLVVRSRDQQGQLTLTCPTCRQVTPVPANGVAGLQSAFHINHLLDILEEHKKAKEGALYCADHQERELELYCDTCEKLICLQCTITEHNGHKYNLLKDVLEQSKQEVTASLTPAKEQLTRAEEQLTAVNKALEQVDTRKREILDQQATVEAKIFEDSQRLIEELVETIKARRIEHIGKLHHITEEKLEALASQREQMETIKIQLSNYLEMVGETLGSHREVTASFQTYILEPITQADMEFSTDNKAVEVCQNYGQLVALGSPDLSKCRATGKSLEVATVGERSTAVLQVDLPCADPIKSLECELVSEITGTRARGSIERRGQSQYEISYQPTIKGRHQLRVKVEGQHIRGSPFSVAVKSPVENLALSTPILTIGGVKEPWGVAINQRGEVVVTEQSGHCVSVFSPKGEKLRSFGKRGSGLGQFNYPHGVAVDGEGNILVADWDNDRIQKFTINGQFLIAVGTTGSGPLKFRYPIGIAFNACTNKVYVGDGGNGRVQILNSSLTYYNSFGKEGSGKGQFKNLRGIACDSSGNVYVADKDNHRIQVFTAEGNFLRWLCGTMEKPIGVAIDTSNNMVYVSELDGHRVSVLTSMGQYTSVTSFGRKGKGQNELRRPNGLAVDSSGVVYVCDTGNNRVKIY